MEKEICEYCCEEIEAPEDIIRMPPDNGPVCYNCFKRLVEAAAPYLVEEPKRDETRPRWQTAGF